MKKFLLAICAVCLLLSGCGQHANDTNVPKSDRKIIVGVDEDYAPISFRNKNGEIVGFDVDLAKQTAKLMGVEFEFKAINWNDKEAELNAGNIDMIWSGMDITPERKEIMLFSKPYMTNCQILLVRKGNPLNIQSIDDLAGKVVGTQDGTTAEFYIDKFDDLKKSFAGFNLYPSFKVGLAALYKKEIDVLIIDDIAGHYGMAREPDNFDTLSIILGDITEFGIGFRKDDTKLRDEVQKAFDELIENGTAQKISLKWLDADLISVHN